MKRSVCTLVSLLLLAGTSLTPAHAQLSAVQAGTDLGTLSEDDPPRTCVFRCRNTGSQPEVITRIHTSCGCTGAKSDRLRLLPGEEAQITVTYRPLGHPGRVLTYIDVFTDKDEAHPAATFTLTGKVTPSKALWKEYRYAMGDLRLRRKRVVFHASGAGRQQVERIVCANAGTEPLTLKAGQGTLPAWLTLRTVPSPIPPGEEGVIELIVESSQLPSTPTGLRAHILLEGLNVRPSERMIEVDIN